MENPANHRTRPAAFVPPGTRRAAATLLTTAAFLLAACPSSLRAVTAGPTAQYWDDTRAKVAPGGGGSGTLSVYDYRGTPGVGGGTDQLFFGTDATGLTSTQLGEIDFYSGGAGSTLLGIGTILSTGEVTYSAVPVPEPATWLGGALLLGGAGWRRGGGQRDEEGSGGRMVRRRRRSILSNAEDIWR